MLAVVYPALQHLALARPAYTVVAAIGQNVTMPDRGFEYGLVWFNRKAVAAGLNGYLKSHVEICRVRESADFNA